VCPFDANGVTTRRFDIAFPVAFIRRVSRDVTGLPPPSPRFMSSGSFVFGDSQWCKRPMPPQPLETTQRQQQAFDYDRV